MLWGKFGRHFAKFKARINANNMSQNLVGIIKRLTKMNEELNDYEME